MMRLAQARSSEIRETLWRTLQTFSFTRVVIALVLLLYVSLNAKGFDARDQAIDWEACAFYLVLAAAFVTLAVYWRKRFSLQLLAQLAVDIAAVSMLYLAAGGASSGLAILYLFPLAGGAILASMLVALFFASTATLVLLLESGYQLLHSIGDAPTLRAGLYGAAFFAVVVMLNRLAAKLIRQEDLAAQRGRELQLQEAINRLVIADMDDGILVVGKDGRIFAGNPAAERMLGLNLGQGGVACHLTDVPNLAPIAQAFRAWGEHHANAAGAAQAASVVVRIKPGEGDADLRSGNTRSGRREAKAHLKLRFATVETEVVREERTIIFLQDVAGIENQAQELKLASMGRLTASIAHEVRNPLAAIAHANSLLGEDNLNSGQSRLQRIIADNARRLDQMVEDILKLSRKARAPDEPLILKPFFIELLNEFRQAHAMEPGVIELGEMASLRVRFDPLHLREVVVNLLSNALRYASGTPASIRIFALPGGAGRLELHVQDDGPAMTPEVRAHLFEPFYTTSSKGTGLGLYLARELCLNNGATLDYEYRFDDDAGKTSGRFVVTLAAPEDL